MKSKIIGLFTAIILFSNISFANGIEPSEALQKEFNKEFAQSTDVEWEKVADFYKASFLMDGQFLTVYFDAFNNIGSSPWIGMRMVWVNAAHMPAKASTDTTAPVRTARAGAPDCGSTVAGVSTVINPPFVCLPGSPYRSLRLRIKLKSKYRF